MSFLFVLLMLQTAGVVLCAIISCFEYLREKTTVYISGNLNHSAEQVSEDWACLRDYFQIHPESSLKNIFPDTYKTAMAIKGYEKLNRLQGSGRLSMKQYGKKLKKFISGINIKTSTDL